MEMILNAYYFARTLISLRLPFYMIVNTIESNVNKAQGKRSHVRVSSMRLPDKLKYSNKYTQGAQWAANKMWDYFHKNVGI